MCDAVERSSFSHRSPLTDEQNGTMQRTTVEDLQDEPFRARIVEQESDWSDENSEEISDSDEELDDEYEVKERSLALQEETVWERISALRDIIPPSTRNSIAARLSTVTSYGGVAALWGGRAAWVLTTTVLLWGLPYSLAAEEEMRVQQQERDFNSQQQGAQQMLGQQGPPGIAAGGQQQSQGIRPPGF